MRTAIPLSLAALSQASPLLRRQDAAGIEFGPCNPAYNFTSGLVCGSLSVPLDYSDPQNPATVDLEILKLPVNGTSSGTIFVNYGGPGANGRADADALAGVQNAMAGGCYDIINIVPRGTNDTLFFNCYPDPAVALTQPLPAAGNQSDYARDETWAGSTVYSSTCAVAQNETGRFIGTAFTARDILSVADALGQETVMYWGISYGTILGATLAALAPERIERMVLDGVVNAHEYYTNTEVQIWDNTDDAFSEMMAFCARAPDVCPFSGGRSHEELVDAGYALFEALKQDPIPVVDPTGLGGALIDYTLVKGLLSRALYSPATWDGILTLMALSETRNLTGILEYYAGTAAQSSPLDADAQFGIKCSDVRGDGQSKEDVLPILEARFANSRSCGDVADHVVDRCAQWGLPAAERYMGNFTEQTKNPILFIGNTFDPVTPYASAKVMAEGFPGSGLFRHDGIGHATLLTQASKCTADNIQRYFGTGEMPEYESFCPRDVVEYGATGWAQLALTLPPGSCAA